jgi:hypothetical protein
MTSRSISWAWFNPHLLRRLLEQSARWVQQTIIDPEGDFVSLTDRFGHLVIDAEEHTERSPLSASERGSIVSPPCSISRGSTPRTRCGAPPPSSAGFSRSAAITGIQCSWWWMRRSSTRRQSPLGPRQARTQRLIRATLASRKGRCCKSGRRETRPPRATRQSSARP